MDAMLTELRGKMASTSKIAAEISQKSGHRITRNAVIGRALRLGLPRMTRQQAQAMHPQSDPNRPRRVKVKGEPRKRRIDSKPLKSEPKPIENMRLVTLMDLNEGECKFIPGEVTTAYSTFYCGLPAVDGHKWCAGHCAIVYRQPAPSGWSRPDAAVHTAMAKWGMTTREALARIGEAA